MTFTSTDMFLQQNNILGLKQDLNELNTGDILLFGGSTFWFSKIVRYWTHSQWTHTAIVLRDPIYINPELTGLYLWESGSENFPDSENHLQKFGVQISSLETLLKKGYDGYIAYRKLTTNIPDIDDKLKAIHKIVHDKPYDINLLDFMKASNEVNEIESPATSTWRFWKWFMPNHRKNNTYFCSALVGFIYTKLGLLPSSTKWTECTPQFFSSEETPSMKLITGSHLGPDEIIYQNPNN
jgi:hypothetical protein